MNTKHTPGAWFITPAQKHGQFFGAGSAHQVRANFAPDDRWRGYVTSVLANSPNSEANARLIAAAPQMLDALERLLESDVELPASIVMFAADAVKAATGAA
jgi:heme oxygenase